METVSVVIPVYNSEKFVEKCIRSVLAQSYRDLEVIAVDDGSTDQSGALLDAMAGEDGRLNVLHQQNRGTSAARNRGLSEATGTYLTFVDADDYIGEDYIRDLVECAAGCGADMVICGATYIDTDGNVLRRLVPSAYVRGKKEEWVFRISAAWAHLYRRSLWTEHHVSFAEGVRGEDMPISLLFSAICDKITTLCQAQYYYVQHDASAMRHFRGLRTYSLPYEALEKTVQQVQSSGKAYSRDYFELFVLRILATCLFQLGRGADRAKMRELSDYIVYLLKRYFPQYDKNRLAGLFSPVEVPFSQKAAVWLLVRLTRTGLIYPLSRLLEGRD